MKKLYIFIPILFLAFIIQCNNVDFGDINDDKDAVINPTTEGLMAGAINRFATLSGREYLLNQTGFVQYQSQYVYTEESRYSETPSTWSSYYVQTLSNLRQVYEMATAEEMDEFTPTFGAPENQAAVAELVSVMIWKRITDSFGPVPYTDAIGQGDTITPEYTDQETIYKDLIKRAKDARDQINSAASGPTGDVFYGGDMDKWKKFANSYIMALTIQLTKVYPNPGEYAADAFKEALDDPNGVIENTDEELWYLHQNIPGATNPYNSMRAADYDLSAPFVDALKGDAGTTNTIGYSNTNYDSRIDVFADNSALSGRPYGLAQTPDPSGTFAKISTKTLNKADGPMPYLTASYTYFNRAEAAVLGWTSEDPADLFEKGVLASYDSYDKYLLDGDGTLNADAASFASARLNDFNNIDKLQVIREEKWVGLFPNANMAWAEWRRTEVPDLIPAPDATNSGVIPRRYLYPSAEAGVNEANYNAGVQQLSPAADKNSSKFWWDK